MSRQVDLTAPLSTDDIEYLSGRNELPAVFEVAEEKPKGRAAKA